MLPILEEILLLWYHKTSPFTMLQVTDGVNLGMDEFNVLDVILGGS